LLARTATCGALVCAALVGLSPFVKTFLHLPSLTSALLLGAYAVPVAVSVVPRGVLAGQGRLGWLCAGLVGGTAVKLVTGIALVHGGAGLDGALAAMVVGEVVPATMALVAVRGVLGAGGAAGCANAGAAGNGSGRQVATAVLRWGDVKGPVAALSGYWVLSAIDVVLARHWLGPNASGWYAAGATVAQVAFFVPGAVAAVAFPRLVGVRGEGQARAPNPRLVLAAGCAVVALVGFFGATTVWVLASRTVSMVFARPYLAAGSVVGLLTFSGALLGLVAVLLRYHLGEGLRLPSSLCWAGVVVVLVGTGAWHRSMVDIAVVTVVATATVCAAMLVVAQGHARGAPVELRERARLALADAALDLTVVVPYYNPGKLLVPTVRRILDALERSGATYEVVAVCDGSTDGSDRELDEALGWRPELSNVVVARNQGKGAALRLGLARGRGRYLGFIDADGDLDPLLLESFQTMVKLYEPDIILGSKRHPLSEVEYPWLRRLYSWGYQQVVRAGFRLDVRDTQTGLKLVRRDVLAAVLPRMVEKRFAFDLELFVVARRLGFKRFLEAPVRLRHQFTSTVSSRSVRAMLVDTLAIWYRLRVLHHYDTDLAPATPSGERFRLEPLVLGGVQGEGVRS
jgi:glycosyltransferase involved in cell wall biosynthesis/O-antigen/teichoic acid export membrane protein